MTESSSHPVNDNAPLGENPVHDLDAALVAAMGDLRIENVVGAAMLVATAFRLRDEDALILTLRRLTDAVALLEADAPALRQVACG